MHFKQDGPLQAMQENVQHLFQCCDQDLGEDMLKVFTKCQDNHRYVYINNKSFGY